MCSDLLAQLLEPGPSIVALLAENTTVCEGFCQQGEDPQGLLLAESGTC